MRVSFLLGFLAFPLAAQAASAPGSGAQAVVCRTPEGRISSAELLDIWEARNFYHRTSSATPTGVDERAKLLLEQLKFAVNVPFDPLPAEQTPASVVADEMSSISDEYLRPSSTSSVDRIYGVSLEPAPDAAEAEAPNFCPLEPLSQEGMGIQVNQDIYDALSPGDQAAFVAHQAFHEILRRYSTEQDSLRVRRAVGYVAGGNSFLPLGTYLGKQYVECRGFDKDGHSRPSDIYFYLDDKKLVQPIAGETFGALAVGFFPTQANQNPAITLPSLVSNELCAGVPLSSTALKLEGRGPADFGRDAWIVFQCRKFRLSIFLSAEESGSLPVAGQALSCRLVNKP